MCPGAEHRNCRWCTLQGEVVVIPAGCAHQVKNGGSGWNIKVAQDFVAPQSAETCLQILREVGRSSLSSQASGEQSYGGILQTGS